MQNPKIHSEIDQFLPEDHWLMEFWLDHHDPSDDEPGGGEIVCERCGRVIYTFAEGSGVLPWVETGRVAFRHGHVEPLTTCLPCFAAHDFSNSERNLMFALTDEGGPQPYDETF